MIAIKTFVFNTFQENTYLLYDNVARVCKVVDPGMSSLKEKDEFDHFLSIHQLAIEAIVNTHCHVDHVLGCRYLQEKYNIPFLTHRDELSLLEKASLYGDFFGLEVGTPPVPDGFISENDEIQIGGSVLSIIHVPGHSEGSVTFFSAEQGFLIAGDVLFRGSIGRTDLPGGDYETLTGNIKSKLLTLPPGVVVYPGHGPSTTIGQEAKTNPFLV
jgi:hydroxyacylglutathione hydrolase